MLNQLAVEAVLTEMRSESFRNESDVQRRLIEPCLKGLGWVITGGNRESGSR